MNKVAQKIISDAGDMAAEIAGKCSEEERAMKEEHDRTLGAIRSEQERNLESVYRAELARILAQERLDHNKNMLKTKWEMIDDLMAGVRSALTGDGALYARFMEEMAIRGVATGNEEIVVAGEDRDLMDAAFLERLNGKARALTGRATNLRLSGDSLESRGGLLMREDRVEFNATLDSVITRIRDDHIIEIARMLFGGEGAEEP